MPAVWKAQTQTTTLNPPAPGCTDDHHKDCRGLTMADAIALGVTGEVLPKPEGHCCLVFMPWY